MKKTIHKVILIHIPVFLLIGLFHTKLLIIDKNLETKNNYTSVKINNDKINNNTTTVNKVKQTEEYNTGSGLNINNNESKNTNLKKDIEIAFLGDVMIGSRVGEAIDKHGQDYVYGGTKDFLSEKDAVILNLETTVTNSEDNINKTYTFKANSDHLEGLKSFNENLVANLANNHIGDFKSEGVIDTINNLKKYNIEYFGAGKNKTEADSLKMIDIQGVKISLIGQTCINPVTFGATEDKAGNSRFSKEIIKQQIKQSRKKSADIIVYNMHCGIEYTDGPNQEQKEYAYFAIDKGADLVIGHHPHWYQPIEIYKDKLIFYSLGNYIFDIFRGRRTQEGIIANIKISNKKIVGAEIIPTYTRGFGSTVLSGKNKKEFALNELYNISKILGNIEGIKNGYIELLKKED